MALVEEIALPAERRVVPARNVTIQSAGGCGAHARDHRPPQGAVRAPDVLEADDDDDGDAFGAAPTGVARFAPPGQRARLSQASTGLLEISKGGGDARAMRKMESRLQHRLDVMEATIVEKLGKRLEEHITISMLKMKDQQLLRGRGF